MTDMTKKSLAEQYAGKCIHFNGVMNKACEAGVDYDTSPRGPIPCLAWDKDAPPCALRHFPTPEEVQAHVAQMGDHLRRRAEDTVLISAAHVDGANSTVYVCELCERAERLVTAVRADMISHLAEAHGVGEDAIRSARGGMDAHLDARDWFQTDDRFTLPDGRPFLIRSVRMPRRGADKAVWADETAGKKRSRR